MQGATAKKARYFLIIIIALFIAHLPVLFSHYIRQDDMAWQLWPGMKFSERADFYSVLVNLFRPVSWPIIIFTDMLSFNTVGAVYARLISILFIILSANLLYLWQLRFTKNAILACAFSILVFTLPPFQTFAATANYLHMLVTLFISICATMLMWSALLKPQQRLKLLAGFLLYVFGLMDYSLASMFAWPMLLMAYLYGLSTKNIMATKNKNQPFYSITLLLIAAQVLYFMMGKIARLLVAKGHLTGPSLTMHLKFVKLLTFFFATITWHAHFWFWRIASMNLWHQKVLLIPISLITCLFALALWQLYRKQNDRLLIIGKVFALTLLALMLSYLPVLISNTTNVNFRYAIATMPLLLFVLYWSLCQLMLSVASERLVNMLAVIIAVGSVCLSYYSLQTYIVTPYTADLAYVNRIVSDKVIPIISKNKPITVAIKCYFGPSQVFEYNAAGFEYGMRIWQYPGQCISAVVHALRLQGIETTKSRFTYDKYTPVSETVKVPWGVLMAVSDELTDKQIKKLASGVALYPVLIIEEPADYVRNNRNS